MISRKHKAILVWFAVSLVGCIGPGTAMFSNFTYLYPLSKSHQIASGEIIEIYPQMHSTCKYRFSVGNHVYEHGGGVCGQATLGEKTVVYYSPTNPDISTNEDPHSTLIDDLIFSAIAIILFPLFAAFVVYKQAK